MPGNDPPPRRPITVRIATALIFVVIGYRVVLILSSFKGLAEGSFTPPPGRLGMPLLVPFLIIGLIVVRRMMQRGHDWARHLFTGDVVLRLVVLAVRGPWNWPAFFLAALYLATVALLFTPPANHWFLNMRSWRFRPREPQLD